MKTRIPVLSICLLSILCLFSGVALAGNEQVSGGRTWFVSVDGSDENPGTADEPFRTISRAAGTAGPGETVRVAAGRYAEAVVFPRSGEEGAPIVFEGERGPAGEWLTILDNSAPVSGWEPAPEVGEGVFKAQLGFNPACLTRDGKMLARVNDSHMRRENDDLRGGFNFLSMPADEPIVGSERMPAFLGSSYTVEEHLFWDGLRALYGTLDGTTYIRFRDGEDPREIELLAAPAGAGFVIRDRGYLVIRGFLVRGAQVSIEISGQGSVGNIIENNRLTHGRRRVEISRGASRNIIRGNEMTLNYYGHDRAGAWGTGRPTMETSLAGFVYRSFKHIVGGNASDDNSIWIHGAGEGNEITGNRIFQGLIGISVGRAPRLRVSGNFIGDMSSIGLLTVRTGHYGAVDAEFHDNRIDNCNIGLRLHHANETLPGERREYHYRNIFTNPEGVGSAVYVHWTGDRMPEGHDHPELYLYHNTMSGGRNGFSVSGWAASGGGMARTVLLNNLFSNPLGLNLSMPFTTGEGMLAVFDHNWLGGGFKTDRPEHDFTQAPWYGENNLFESGSRAWPRGEEDDFELPGGHAARGAGLDLSEPFSVGGKDFPALPGLEPGYFEGEKPDIGAVQHGRKGPDLLPGN